MKYFLTVLILSALSFQSHGMSSHSPCIERRGAIDVGSGSTKALGAIVDICKQQIVKVLLDEQTPISFKDSGFNPDVISEAQVKFTSLIKALNKMEIHHIKAVATEAFRQIKNGPEVADEISRLTSVHLKVITQKEEAALGVASARAAASPETVVWDIGGGSMQITAKDEVFLGKLASVSFKDLVIKKIKNKDPKQMKSPNPLKKWEEAIALSQNHAKKHLPENLKTHFKDANWVGIGGVWWHSVRSQIKNKNEAKLDELRQALKLRSTLNDSQIGGSYSSTEITNLALVIGYMEALGISSVTPVKATLAQGLLFHK